MAGASPTKSFMGSNVQSHGTWIILHMEKTVLDELITQLDDEFGTHGPQYILG